MSAFRQQLQVFIDANLAPAARSARFVGAVIAARDDLISTNQASARYDTFVDGSAGVPESRVSADHGRILYVFDYIGAAAAFALGFIRARSPVASGLFQNSFMVAIDGRPVSAASFSANAAKGAAEIIIYNTQPYARKVDVQLAGKVRYRFSVPPGMFDDTAAATQRAYAGTIKARRIGNISSPSQAFRVARHGGAKISTPALVLSALT